MDRFEPTGTEVLFTDKDPCQTINGSPRVGLYSVASALTGSTALWVAIAFMLNVEPPGNLALLTASYTASLAGSLEGLVGDHSTEFELLVQEFC